MGKRNHLKAIRSLEHRIQEHLDKIRLEEQKEQPDSGLIRHCKFTLTLNPSP